MNQLDLDIDSTNPRTPCVRHGCPEPGTHRRFDPAALPPPGSTQAEPGAWVSVCDFHADRSGFLGSFDPDLGRQAADQAIAAVDDAARHDWKTTADEAIEDTARRLAVLSADDVWKTLDRWEIPRPREGRALGPRMKVARSRGIIEPTGGFISSERPELHSSPTRVYRSLIYIDLFGGDS